MPEAKLSMTDLEECDNGEGKFEPVPKKVKEEVTRSNDMKKGSQRNPNVDYNQFVTWGPYSATVTGHTGYLTFASLYAYHKNTVAE